MSRKEDYLDRIEDFSEVVLPEVEMYEKDKQKIKIEVIDMINKLKSKNRDEFNINVTEEEAIEMKLELGEDADKRVRGVKSAKFMKEIIEKTIEKELEREKIVHRVEFILPSIMFYGLSSIYNYMIVTEDSFIWYGFDSNYKIVTKGRRKIAELNRVGRVRFCSDDEAGVEFYVSGKDFYFPMIIRGDKAIKKMDEVIAYLSDEGVKKFNKDKFAKYEKIFYIVLYGLAAIGMFKAVEVVFGRLMQ